MSEEARLLSCMYVETIVCDSLFTRLSEKARLLSCMLRHASLFTRPKESHVHESISLLQS